MPTDTINQSLNTKKERFIRIAEKRVNKILDGLDNLANCANKRNYDYTEDEVRKIYREIEKKVKETKLQFKGNGESKRRFQLKG